MIGTGVGILHNLRRALSALQLHAGGFLQLHSGGVLELHNN